MLYPLVICLLVIGHSYWTWPKKWREFSCGNGDFPSFFVSLPAGTNLSKPFITFEIMATSIFFHPNIVVHFFGLRARCECEETAWHTWRPEHRHKPSNLRDRWMRMYNHRTGMHIYIYIYIYKYIYIYMYYSDHDNSCMCASVSATWEAPGVLIRFPSQSLVTSSDS